MLRLPACVLVGHLLVALAHPTLVGVGQPQVKTLAVVILAPLPEVVVVVVVVLAIVVMVVVVVVAPGSSRSR